MQLIDDFVTTKYNIELLKIKLQKEKSKEAGALGVTPTKTGGTTNGLTGLGMGNTSGLY